MGNAKGLASLHEWQALSSIRSSACIMGWALISLSIYQERKKSRRIKIRIQERKKDYDDLSGQLNHLMGLGKERGTSVCGGLMSGRRAICLSLASFPLCVLLSCFRAVPYSIECCLLLSNGTIDTFCRLSPSPLLLVPLLFIAFLFCSLLPLLPFFVLSVHVLSPGLHDLTEEQLQGIMGKQHVGVDRVQRVMQVRDQQYSQYSKLNQITPRPGGDEHDFDATGAAPN